MSDEIPLVSVVIPTYRHSQYLPTAILSVKAQEYPRIELIVVNVAGDDKTSQVLGNLSMIFDIKCVRSEKADHIHQYNLGIKEAKGKYMMVFGSDDFMLPNKIQTEMAVAATNNAVLVYSRFFLGDENLNIRAVPPIFYPFSYKWLVQRNFIADVSLVAREMYDEFGLFNESLGSLAVYEKWLRIAEKYEKRIIFNPYPTFIYRTHPEQKHTRRLDDPKQAELYNQIVKASLERKGLSSAKVDFHITKVECERV